MKKRHFIKIWIVLVVVMIMSFSDWGFAAEWEKLKLLNEMSKLLHIIVSILSWIWVFFAQGAWEFLTNKWVYWEILWLDALLWKFWNIVKNIANFWLWFYFIYEIFRWLIDGTQKLKNKLIWLLVAWIWIQASWFMTAVVLDVSTITLATAGSFPSLVISEVKEVDESFDTTIEDYFNLKEIQWSIDELKSWMTFSLFAPDMWASNFITIKRDVPLKEWISKKKLLDTIMPNSENVAWPLYYLWFSILRTTTIISPSSTNDEWFMTTIFNTLIQWWTTIVFAIEMLVLLIVAVMRLLYMWVFIVLSPLVVLLECIKQSGWASKSWNGKKFLDGFTKQFNLTSFFWNAFKPTLIVLCFSVAMIFTALMSKVIISNGEKELDMGWMKTSRSVENAAPNTWNDWDKQYTTIMDGDLAEIMIKKSWKTLFNFILSVITVVLVYLIIRFAVKMGWWSDFVSKTAWKIQDTVQSWIASMPLVPVSWWDEKWKPETHYISAGTTFWFDWSGTNRKGLLGAKIDDWRTAVEKSVSTQTDSLNNLFGWANSKTMSESDWNGIKTAWESGWQKYSGLRLLEAKKDAINRNKTEAGWWFRLDPRTWDKRWIDVFTQWLKNTAEWDIDSYKPDGVSPDNLPVWRKMVIWWKEHENGTLEQLFEDGTIWKKAVKAYAEFFWIKDIDKIISWTDLKARDISKSEESDDDAADEKSE